MQKKQPPNISPQLFWEYDLSQFDWDVMKVLVAERIVSRGWPEDWHAMLDYFGYNKVRVRIIDLKETDLLYYTKKRLNPLPFR
ncbi:MAG: hypothetical protein ABJA79_00985 [Parafilimonas sp.]